MTLKNTNFIQEIIELAEAENIVIPEEYKKGGIKPGIKLSSACDSLYGEKTVASILSKVPRKIFHDEPDFRMIDLRDPIRVKIILENYHHIPNVMELIKQEVPNTNAELQFNRERNYRGTHLNTTIEGLSAEIQLVSSVQGLVYHITGSLYGKAREHKIGSPERDRIVAIIKHCHGLLWENSVFWNTDFEIRSKSIEFGTSLTTDISRLSKDSDIEEISETENIDVLKELSVSAKMVAPKGNIMLDEELIKKQAKLMNRIAVKKQPKLVKFSEDIFEEYKTLLNKNALKSAGLNKKQWFVKSLFDTAAFTRINELSKQGVKNPDKYMRDNYGKEIETIEKKHVIPALEQASDDQIRE